MKKALFLLLITFIFSEGFSQICHLQRDSIIAGSRVSSFSDYIYDVLNRLTQVSRTDSGSLVVTTSDAVYYNGSGDVSKVETYYTVGTPVLKRTVQYTYTSGKITRVDVSGDDNGAWTMSHDVTYNGNDIQSIVLDGSSVTGSPQGLQGSFIDMVWSNGNVATLSLVVGTDTIELAATYDNKHNIYANFPNTDGASFLFQSKNVNNILNVQTVNAETFMGGVPVGTKVLDNTYTYDSNNNVLTNAEAATPFNGQAKTTQFTYDCSSGIALPHAATALNFYPNPAESTIAIENGMFKGTVKIFDATGKEITLQKISSERSTLDVSHLAPGVYYIEMSNAGSVSRGKILKN